MGHRANCVIIEQSQSKIYYAHGNATIIPKLLLEESHDNWQHIEGYFTPVEKLLPINRAQGGILVDRDRHRLLFWGGEDIKIYPYLRRPLLSTLRSLCPDWRVEWAIHGNADLANALSLDLTSLLVGDFAEGFNPDHPLSDEELLADSDEETILTVRWEDGMLFDYHLSYLPATVLAVGPHLLEVLPQKKTAMLPHERDEEYDGGAFLDLTTHEMSVWTRSTIDPRYLMALTQLWTGWHITRHVEGLVRQVSLSGRDPSAITVAHHEAAAKLANILKSSLPLNRIS